MKKSSESETEMRGTKWHIAKTIDKKWPANKKFHRKPPIEKPIESEVALAQRVILKEGRYEITTDFINGKKTERDVFTFDAPHGAAETALGAIDHHQMELHDDIKELKADAERYARIKSHDRDSPYLSSLLIKKAFDEYAFMYTGVPRSKQDFAQGREDSSNFPALELRAKLDNFRQTLQGSLDDREVTKKHKLRTGLPKLDAIERNIVHMNEWLTEIIMTQAMANAPVHDEEDGGGLAMLAEPQERPKSKEFREFSRKIIEITDRCNEAWLLAAEAISKNEKLPSAALQEQVVEIRTVAGLAKKDLIAFEYEIEERESPNSPNSLELKQALEEIEKMNHGEKGLFVRLDAILGILSRDDLLKSTIEKGMTKEMGK